MSNTSLVGKWVVFIAAILCISAAESPKTILFFGDSLTAGYGLSVEQAFPALIEKQLQAKGITVKAINAGLSGETSAGGLARIDWVLRQPVDVFVLELGANDGLRGLPVEQTRQNLQTIIDKVRQRNPAVTIVLTGMMVPPNMGPDYTAAFKRIYPDLSKSNRVKLMPFLLADVAGHEELNQADGIH
ncbi:MAG TPA: arylesterase, partial [Acidobacteriota bacterium]|nr:arylesterase [Acidobacteriota bacterium]